MKNDIRFYISDRFEMVEGDGWITLGDHTHRSFLMGLLTEGSARYTLGGMPYLLNRGDGYLLPPDVPIAIEAITRNAYKVLCIDQAAIPAALLEAPPGVFHCEPERFDVVAQRLLHSHSRIEDMLGELDIEISRFPLTQLHPGPIALDDTTGRSLDYIHRHIEEKFSLDALAKAVCVSKYHLDRCFKRAMGITPKQYATQCKLREAKRRLVAGDPAAAIAVDLAFSAQSHLCTVFRGQMGLSPENYRRATTKIAQ